MKKTARNILQTAIIATSVFALQGCGSTQTAKDQKANSMLKGSYKLSSQKNEALMKSSKHLPLRGPMTFTDFYATTGIRPEEIYLYEKDTWDSVFSYGTEIANGYALKDIETRGNKIYAVPLRTYVPVNTFQLNVIFKLLFVREGKIYGIGSSWMTVSDFQQSFSHAQPYKPTPAPKAGN